MMRFLVRLRQSTVFSTKSRRAARLSLFPGETISITASVDLVRGAADDPRDGRWQSGDAAVQLFAQVPFGANLDRQHTRFLRPSPLFNEGRDPLG